MKPVIELFQLGGIFMYPLLLCSIIGLGVIFERLWVIHRARINTSEFIKNLLSALRGKGVEAACQLCEKTKGPIATALHAGLRRVAQGVANVEKAIESAATVEISLLERGLVILSTISAAAPLLGFLGTVSGMITAFRAIAQAEQVTAKLVATGIYEALVTTATGLIIAIPCLAFHNYFVHQVDKFVIELEESSFSITDALTELEVRNESKKSEG